ncbi:MAG: substrate-binding domain-containing protein [Devosia sp.]|nr:substrate-binding domain-containing protein [Devosia sp.]
MGRLAMKIGLLMTRSGVAGVWSPSCDAAGIIGAAELNAAGGVLGDEVQLSVADCGMTLNTALAATDYLLDVEEVDAIVGLHTSTARDAVTARLGGRVPYVYAAQYEGVRCGPSTVATGPVDYEILRPAIHWLMDSKQAQRFYFIGNDYVWPRTALDGTRAVIAERGAHLVGHAFVPLAEVDYGQVMEDIARAQPDVVIQMLIGQTAIDFNRAFSRKGLDAKILRFGLAIDETVLCGIGAEGSHGLFSGATYFASWRSHSNDRFLELYHDAFGALAPPANAVAVSCYEGIHVVAGLARQVGHRDGPSLARLLRRPMSRSTARHAMAHSPIGLAPQVHIAKANGVSFDVVASL